MLTGTEFLRTLTKGNLGSEIEGHDVELEVALENGLMVDEDNDWNEFSQREAEVMQLLPTVDAAAVTEEGFSILHLACLFGSEQLFNTVKDNNDLFRLRTHGSHYTALHIAIIQKRANMVQLIVDDPRTSASDLIDDFVIPKHAHTESPFKEAIHRKSLKIVRALLNKIMQLVDDREGFLTNTVLHFAEKGPLKMLLLMIKDNHLPTGFLIPQEGGHRISLLHLVLKCERSWHKELLLRLLEERTILNLLDKEGKTPLDYACNEQEGLNDELVLRMMDVGCDFGPFHSSGDLLADEEYVLSRERYQQIKSTKLFSTVVLLSDGYLRLTQEENKTTRFFSIAQRLPMELQMIVCNRAYGNPEDIVPSKRVNLFVKKMIE